MITVRKSEDRGHADHGWLKTYHTFSFSTYFDPNHNHFRSLRVINEDWISSGEGFGTHPHENMEIVTYVIEGALEHRDSMGNGSVIHQGELQRMTAGTGVTHSEFSASDNDTHLLQIWIYPERCDLDPSYEQRQFDTLQQANSLTLLGSQTGRDGSLTIHQDVDLYGGRLEAGQQLDFRLQANRHAWIQLISGKLSLNGTDIKAGDGAAIDDEMKLAVIATSDCDFLLFDLA